MQVNESEIQMKCFFVEDDAFPLSDIIMKPYSGHFLSEDKRIFNYRLSRTRRVIENCFGIMARWRIFQKPIAAKPGNVDKLVLSCMCLHNYLKKREDLLEPEERTYCLQIFQTGKVNKEIYSRDLERKRS